MPRLTGADYLNIHRQLRQIWIRDQARFADLCPEEQWNLHAYFQPSKNLTEKQLIAHRGEISWHQPNLPHQAGKALAKLRRGALAPTRQGITVRGVVRPEPDLHKLARALRDLAKHQERQAREESEPPAA